MIVITIMLALIVIIIPTVIINRALNPVSPASTGGNRYTGESPAEWWYDISSFLFYESWLTDDYPPDWEEKTASEFTADGSYYIYFVLTLSHREVKDDFTVPGEMYYYDPDGIELTAHNFDLSVETGYDESDVRGYFGWDQPGKWKLGVHSVEVWLNGDLAAVDYFEMQ